MPTAAEYDLWAWGLDDRAGQLTGLVGPVLEKASPDALSGGTLTVTVDLALRAALANSLGGAGLLRELAEVCRERADICREYETAMLEYERRRSAHSAAMAKYVRLVEEAETNGTYIGSPPWPPTEPSKPFEWVER